MCTEMVSCRGPCPEPATLLKQNNAQHRFSKRLVLQLPFLDKTLGKSLVQKQGDDTALEENADVTFNLCKMFGDKPAMSPWVKQTDSAGEPDQRGCQSLSLRPGLRPICFGFPVLPILRRPWSGRVQWRGSALQFVTFYFLIFIRIKIIQETKVILSKCSSREHDVLYFLNHVHF